MKMLAKGFLALCLVLAGLTGYWAYLGYFGGELFVPVPAERSVKPHHPGVAAVIVSGDMGFKVGMGPRIAAKLSADGIPVTGVNSLVYFRHRRTPAEIEQLIAAAVRRGLAFGHAQRVILIGQSFGADMVHVGLANLPPRLRSRIAMVALVVPTDSVNYKASPAELFDLVPADAPALPTAQALTWIPTFCVYDQEETDSLCPLLTASNVRKVALPGGHALHRDAEALYAQIARAIDMSISR